MRNRPERVRLGVLAGLLLIVALAALLLQLRRDDGTELPVSADTRTGSAIKRPVLSDELEPIRARLGAARYSSHSEELFVRDFFSDMRDGFFLDIGAGHYRDRSNTYFLEEELGWSGIAVDPLPHLAAGYRKHRPRTKFFAMFVSDVSDQQATLYEGDNALFSSAERGFTEQYTDVRATREVRTIKLDDLLDAEGIGRIDFMSLDIEQHEPQALDGLDLKRFLPKLICVEAHPQVRQQILDYFAKRRYVVVAKYLRADPQNLWFMPLPD